MHYMILMSKKMTSQSHITNPKTLAARGLEEHMQITLIFARIISFMLFTVCPKLKASKDHLN